jgi:hypothetical protein
LIFATGYDQNNGVVHPRIRDSFFDKSASCGKAAIVRMGLYSARLFSEAQNGKINLEVSESKNLITVSVSLPRFVEVSDLAWSGNLFKIRAVEFDIDCYSQV